MNAKEKLTRMNKLLEVYGSLLTKTQIKIMEDKYVYDLSLKEISEKYHISRSAALDAIKVASDKLEMYETKLCLIHKKEIILKLIKDEKIKKKIRSVL